ncbi:aquaporin NIP3-1-like [Triticum aestivum]|uniref:aquaporin NIP3-1-like n=1 Tax=Triticum aestivum TaxID=4565 RepID=UPI001D01AB5B|nr:aquaporin NIP3-1-like [Triticum aestivum]
MPPFILPLSPTIYRASWHRSTELSGGGGEPGAERRRREIIGTELGAEFVGTFILIFFATAAPIVNLKYGGMISPFGNAACAGLVVTTIILSTGPTIGGSMNPVRTLGPAVAAGNYRQLWIYLVAPTLGAVCGAGVQKRRI